MKRLKRLKTPCSRCFICGYLDESDKNVSHFMFPKDDERRSAWMRFAELDASINVANLRLCSKHFASDFLKRGRHKFLLTGNAIPTLLPNVTKRICDSDRIKTRYNCLLCKIPKNEKMKIKCSRFPDDDALKKKWAAACGIDVHKIAKNSRLCWRHFQDTDFIEKIVSKGEIMKRLKRDAIPSVQITSRIVDVEAQRKLGKSPCIICGYNSGDVSYHRFPIDDERRKEWLRICELEGEDPKNLYVCGRHFPDSDKIQQHHRTMLTNTAKPILNLTTYGFEEMLEEENENVPRTAPNELCENSSAHVPASASDRNVSNCTSDKSPRNTPTCVPVMKPSIFTFISASNLNLRSDILCMTPRSCIREPTSPEHDASVPLVNLEPEVIISENCIVETPDLDVTNTVSYCAESSTSICIKEHDYTRIPLRCSITSVPASATTISSQTTAPEARELPDSATLDSAEKESTTNVTNQEPPAAANSQPLAAADSEPLACRKLLRYCGDVRIPDLASPQRAERCWNIAQKTIEKKNKKIRSLGLKNVKLLKKVRRLNDIVNHLKTEEMISDNAAEILLVALTELECSCLK